MRFLRLAPVLLTAFIGMAPSAHADSSTMAQCKTFFQKFQTCVDGLQGEQKDEAAIFMKTMRGTLGMSDDLNRGDPMLTGMMCGLMIEEAKKDTSIQQYKCQW
jgi:hypothetical protein